MFFTFVPFRLFYTLIFTRPYLHLDTSFKYCIQIIFIDFHFDVTKYKLSVYNNFIPDLGRSKCGQGERYIKLKI